MAAQFHDDEVLEDWSGGGARVGQACRPLAEQVAQETGIHEGEFGCADRAVGSFTGPGGNRLDEEYGFQQRQVAGDGGAVNVEFTGDGCGDERVRAANSEKLQQFSKLWGSFDGRDFLDVACDEGVEVACEECGAAPVGTADRFGESADRGAFDVVTATQIRVTGELGSGGESGVDEAVRSIGDLTLGEGPQLDGFHPPGQGIGQ